MKKLMCIIILSEIYLIYAYSINESFLQEKEETIVINDINRGILNEKSIITRNEKEYCGTMKIEFRGNNRLENFKSEYSRKVEMEKLIDITNVPERNLNEYWKKNSEINFNAKRYNVFLKEIKLECEKVYRITDINYMNENNLGIIEEYILIRKDEFEEFEGLEFINISSRTSYIYDFSEKEIKRAERKYEINFADKAKNTYYIKGTDYLIENDFESDKKNKCLKKIKDYIEKNDIKNIDIIMRDKEVVIETDGVYFDPESSIINEDGKKVLDNIKKMIELLNCRINIKGYCADVGDERAIMRLSQERADKVNEYLNYRNTENVKGYGAEEPAGDNGTKEGRKLNRRVEFEIKI